MKTATLLSSLIVFSAFAGSNEKFSELQNTLFDTYMFELRRKELREENRTRVLCTQPEEALSYRMINYLTGIVDRADGLPTTETVWNPNPELSEWEMLQDDGFTLVENRRNGWDDEEWNKKKQLVKNCVLISPFALGWIFIVKDIKDILVR